MQLNREQRQLLENGKPLRLEVEGSPCVLISAEIYDRARMVFDSPNAEEMDGIMEQTWGNDPALHLYQDYK